MGKQKRAAWEFYQEERTRISEALSERRRRASEAYMEAMRAAKERLDAENAAARSEYTLQMKTLGLTCHTIRTAKPPVCDAMPAAPDA